MKQHTTTTDEAARLRRALQAVYRELGSPAAESMPRMVVRIAREMAGRALTEEVAD